MNPAAETPSALGRLARFASWSLLAYWAVFAAVAPLINIDSQMYHVARLELAARGGLFNNGWFTSMYHVLWPWTFDAVHLPFLGLGWGYALPSFACFAGLCFVVHAMMRAHFGFDAAWVAVAGLLGLTCLVYQATSTSNDIPILFSGAVWTYARWRRARENKNVHLFWMVLAIGFMAGAKTTGMLYAAILSAWTLWELRADRKLLARVIAGLVGSLVLLGSSETYVESARVFGHPLGPPEYLRSLKNSDGIRGGLANLTRYVAGSVYVGPAMVGDPPGAVTRVIKAEQALLTWTGLNNQGARGRTNDNALFLFQSGIEELSGFGPIGMFAMAIMLVAVVWWRPRTLWWQLAAIGLVGVLIVSFGVGYTYWGNRYLIAWYALASVACVCALWEHQGRAAHFLRWSFAACAVASAVAAPLLSFNRRPVDIAASFSDRDRLETSAYPLSGVVRNRLRELHRSNPSSRVYYVVCTDSVIFPILEDHDLHAHLVTPPRFVELIKAGQVSPGDLVIEDCPSGASILRPIEEVSAPDIFSRANLRRQIIYRVSP